MTGPRSVDFRRIGMGGSAAACVIVVAAAVYAWRAAASAWDFETYYYAAQAAISGWNPYSLNVLRAVAGRTIELPFLYPPGTLGVFLPFATLPVAVASRLWLALQALTFVLLVWRWRHDVVGGIPLAWLIVASILGFDAAALWCLRSGNIAIVEAMLLWIGLAAFLRGRLGVAAVFIAIAGSFKLLPLAFLLVIAARPERLRAKLLGWLVACVVVAAAVMWPSPLGVAWVDSVRQLASAPMPGAQVNPSWANLAAWLASRISSPVDGTAPIAALAYAAGAVAFSVASWPSIRRDLERGDREHLLATFGLWWLLVTPRVMIYTYVIVVPFALFALWRSGLPRGWKHAASLGLCAQGLVRLVPGPAPSSLAFLPLFWAIVAWGLLVFAPARVAAETRSPDTA